MKSAIVLLLCSLFVSCVLPTSSYDNRGKEVTQKTKQIELYLQYAPKTGE